VRFASLGSGSRGNGTVVQADGTTVLVDCGFSLRETTRRLQRLGLAPGDLSAVLLTHEHGDHVSGAGALARRYRLPVWLTAGTLDAAVNVLGELPEVVVFPSHQAFALGALQIEPLAVPHDAREPCQFVFGDGARRFALVTDVGRQTPFLRRRLDGCDALLLEFNHDETMLAAGGYPQGLKQRIAGDLGHLSNRQAGELLGAVDGARLQHCVAAHLSAMNNTAALARAAAAAALGCTPDWIGVADQDQGLDWRALNR